MSTTTTPRMSGHATITITSGPDRGQVFHLDGELTHLGHSAENEVALSDSQLAEEQAVIVNRGGRHAIYTPLAETVTVDGQVIPADRWVWLPEVARVRISKKTSFQFNTRGTAAVSAAPASDSTGKPSPSGPTLHARPLPVPKRPGPKPAPAEASPDDPSPKRSGRRRKKNSENSSGKQQVARFITTDQGDSLVKLGEDGHLPELSLADGSGGNRNKKLRAKSDSKGGIYLLLGFSVFASMILALLDLDPASVSDNERAKARAVIAEFYPKVGAEPEPYQQHLIEARLARSRGNRAEEVRHYREVLDLLNAEDTNVRTGLTGNQNQDRRLREAIGIVVSR